MSKQQNIEKPKKPIYKKWWFWLIIVIVILAIAGNSGGDTEKPSSNPQSTDKPVTTDKPAQEEKTASIGDTIRVGDVEFTVNKTSTAKNVGGEWGSTAQGTFLLVNVTVKNVGNEAITTDSSFFKIKVNDKKYEADSSASIHADSELKFFLQKVNPDLSNTGTVVFDVTDEVIANPELTLQVQTGFWGTQTGEIKLAQ